jgi:alpha-methylacyl-CoA racemase
MTLPLAGIRVLDLTRLLPGAVCTMMLTQLGADVIKIEGPDGGDYARLMPPYINGTGAYFYATNQGKRSAVINLKDMRGQVALRRLVQQADVLVESYRPGVMARLHSDYAALKSVNPRLVYCALSGWGQDGPYADQSGHDLNYGAVGGLVGAMGQAQPPGGQMADIGGAYIAVSGILAALLRRERTGEGAFIDTSLFESALPFLAIQWIEAVTTSQWGSLTGGKACYNTYAAGDGRTVALAALESRFWANFCNAVERSDLIAYHQDGEKQTYLIAELKGIFSQRSAADWQALLGGADCCFSIVNNPDEVANDPQVQARGVLGVDENGAPWLNSPIRLNGITPSEGGLAPRYGQHTSEILRENGFAESEIDELLREGIIEESVM